MPFLVVALLTAGFAIAVYNIVQVSYRQAICPPRLQGRMNSVMRFIVWGTIPLGGLVGGALATAIGLRETLFVGSVASCFCFLFLLAEPLRSIRQLPDPDEAPPDGPEEELVELPLEAQRAET